MLINPERTIKQVLRKHQSETAKLLGQLQLIEKIFRQVQQVLPPELRDNVRVQSYQRGTLTLASTSAALLHQLRFSIPELLSALRQQGLPGLVTIKSVVAPAKTCKKFQEAPIIMAARAAHPDVAAYLEGNLDNIKDTELQQALAQLAKHLRDPG